MSIPKNHKAALFHFSETERVRYFQRGQDDLVEDGIYGPKTAAALDRYIADEFPSEPSEPCEPSLRKAFESALLDVGQHEVPMGSNNGPYVESLRLEADLPRLDHSTSGGQWCAVFQTVHCGRAGVSVSSRGARAIVNQLIALPRGREVSIDEIGDGFVGLALLGRGHVQIFIAYQTEQGLRIQHVGGNEKHRVVTKHHTPEEFFKDVVKVGTYV